MENASKTKPNDYVISTGKQFTVKYFVNLVLKQLNIKFLWKGKGVKENVMTRMVTVVACSNEYFRPLEVDTLLGDSRKAKKSNWKPKTSIKSLVREMVNFD